MSVLVDTNIWSLALRRKVNTSPETTRLAKLWRDGQAKLIGPVRQELLSGVRDKHLFERLRQQLRVEPDYSLSTDHYELAAEFSNLCRSRGVQGTGVDFLLCAVAVSDNLGIYTLDKDFTLFARYLPIRLI